MGNPHYDEMARARDSETLPANFDQQYEACERAKRIRLMVISAILFSVVATGMIIWIESSSSAAQKACLDSGGRWDGSTCLMIERR